MPESSTTVRKATTGDAGQVGAMISRLLCELYPDLAGSYQPAQMEEVAKRLVQDDAYTALVAVAPDGNLGGVVGLNECKAIYAHGTFGEITEIYVDPAYRSSGIGAQLIAAATAWGKLQRWSLLEVGAPDVPRWQRTVDFYLRCGFIEVGPRLYQPLQT